MIVQPYLPQLECWSGGPCGTPSWPPLSTPPRRCPPLRWATCSAGLPAWRGPASAWCAKSYPFRALLHATLGAAAFGEEASPIPFRDMIGGFMHMWRQDGA